jgi:hypothetical protein
MQERYGKKVAAAICAMAVLPEALEVRDDGVYVRDEYQLHDSPEEVFSWTPPCDMDWPNSPDPLGAPSLPIPFTSAELAAFMLHGIGGSIQEIFGEFGDPPDEKALARLGPKSGKARKALREAYSLALEAQSVVGRLNNKLQQRANELLGELDDANLLANEREGVFDRAKKQDKTPEPAVQRLPVDPNDIDFTQTGKRLPSELLLPVKSVRIARSADDDELSERRERAKSSVAELDAMAQKVAARAKAERDSYRKAMVRQLLLRQVTAAEPEQTDAGSIMTSAGSSMSEDASGAPAEHKWVKRGSIYKKNVLIKRLVSQWPSIENDFQHADTNGLRLAAKATKHGEYFEDAALDWARKKGKLKESVEEQAIPANSIFNSPRRRIVVT